MGAPEDSQDEPAQDLLSVRLSAFDLQREAERMQVLQEMSARANESDADREAVQVRHGTNCVLVVDDRASATSLLSEQLEAFGVRVHAANAVLPALAALDDHLPALIVLDVLMPAVDGLELCRLLKRLPETRDVPVAILTSLDREDVESVAIESGADYVLTKPLSLEQVADLVSAHRLA